LGGLEHQVRLGAPWGWATRPPIHHGQHQIVDGAFHGDAIRRQRPLAGHIRHSSSIDRDLGRQVVRQPVQHLGVRQPPPGGLAVEVRALRPAEPDDLLLARQQVVKLPRLAGEE
jgi:hypothetical protein